MGDKGFKVVRDFKDFKDFKVVRVVRVDAADFLGGAPTSPIPVKKVESPVTEVAAATPQAAIFALP